VLLTEKKIDAYMQWCDDCQLISVRHTDVLYCVKTTD